MHTTPSLSKHGWILTHGEADQVGTETEAGTLTCRNTDGGRDGIKDGEDDCGEDGESRDLIQWQSLLWDKNGRRRNNETLDQVLNDAIDNFSKSVAHHDSILHLKKKTRQSMRVLFASICWSLKHPIFRMGRDEYRYRNRGFFGRRH